MCVKRQHTLKMTKLVPRSVSQKEPKFPSFLWPFPAGVGVCVCARV